ncbi:MAG: phosphonopyruvate decarboxylase [Alphaproteobacteria bacterium]|nr:phosphonopyruvate decarboxylase [Alphaproteobacteria bacterium]
MTSPTSVLPPDAPAWPADIYRTLRERDIKQVSYVPDAGHKHLINMCHADNQMKVVTLTTEEEGVALACGAWLGGERSVLLMQSSGVGNCINMMSMLKTCQFPFLTLVTMRGDFGEGNPWQVPMGQATKAVLEAMGLIVYKVERPEDVGPTVDMAAQIAYDSQQPVAVLIGQKVIGAKKFVKKG